MNKNRLQLLHHVEVFESKNAMERYISRKYLDDALVAEPFVMFYKDGDETRMVLAVGNPSNEDLGCELIDIKDLEARVVAVEQRGDELAEEMAQLKDAFAVLKDDIAAEVAERKEVDANIAELCGFTYNEKSGEYEYKPDSKDMRIADAKSLAEAVDMISKSIKDYSFATSKSVRFTVDDDNVVTAEVRLSQEDRDEDGHDDNIIVKYNDGIGAYIDLKFDPDKGGLLFTRSTTESKKHKTELIQIPTHTDVKLDKKSDLHYDLVVDGAVVGSIVIPEDQFFRGASYDARVHELTLTFRVSGADETVVIPLTDLVDIYQAGPGLALNNNGKFRVVKSAASEDYLVVSENGVAIMGIDKAIADARAEANLAAQKLVADKADELIGHADAGVDELSIYGVRNRIDAESAKIDNSIAQMEDTVDNALAQVDDKIATKVDTIVVHTKNGVEQTVEVVDGKATIDMGQLNLYVNGKFQRSFAPGVGGSKNIGTSYGSFALDFASSDTAEIELGSNEQGIPSIKVNVDKELFDKEGAAAQAIADAKAYTDASEKRVTISTKDSTSLKLNAVKGLDGTELSGNVAISKETANAIVEKTDGLYAPSLDLSYNERLNILSVSYGGKTEDIQLTGVTAFEDVRYDSKEQSLVITIRNEEGIQAPIIIPLAGLIPLVEGVGDENSVVAISVEKSTKEDGDVINLISAKFNGWAKDIKTAYHIDATNEDLTDADMTFQHILNHLKDILTRMELLETQMEQLTSDVDGIKNYKVNGKKISDNPVLNGEDILVGGTSQYRANNISSAIELLNNKIGTGGGGGGTAGDFSVLNYVDANVDVQVVSSVSEANGIINVKRYVLKPVDNDGSIVVEQNDNNIEFCVGTVDCGTYEIN